jgi:menaquinone-specific isochorismate synthase
MPHSILDLFNESLNTRELVDSVTGYHELRTSVREICTRAETRQKTQLFAVTLPFEQVDPLAALELLGRESDFQYYWEHPDEKLSFAGGGETERIKTNQRDRFNIVNRQIDQIREHSVNYAPLTHSLSGIHFLGGFSFQDQPQDHQWRNFGTATFIVPEWLIIRDGQLSLLTITTRVKPGTPAESLLGQIRERVISILSRMRSFSQQDCPADVNPNGNHSIFEAQVPAEAHSVWKNTITRAKDRIRQGEFHKIVLAREVPIKLHRRPEPTRMLNFLRNEYPTCYTFMMRMNRNAIFLGSTPEKLVAFRSTFMLTDGLAGTISRGKTASEDTVLERRLLHSDKDLREHGFVVQAIGDRLREVTHNLSYPNHPGIRKYPNVQHLYTPISASINKDTHPLDIVEKLHPTPAVGGFPREKTVDQIQPLEQIDRGWYAGPVGWINTNGRGEFCVAIRSGIILEKQARFFAGCGIVADSDPQGEWDETNLKLIPMLTALQHA